MATKSILVALYWSVQPYRPGARVQAERRCADFGEVIASLFFVDVGFGTHTRSRARRLFFADTDSRRES